VWRQFAQAQLAVGAGETLGFTGVGSELGAGEREGVLEGFSIGFLVGHLSRSTHSFLNFSKEKHSGVQ